MVFSQFFWPAALQQLQTGDGGRVHREGPLDTNPEGDLPNRERLADPTAGTTDDDPLEDLNALTISLDHTDMHLDRVARSEIGDIVAQEGLLDQIRLVHGRPSSVPAASLPPVATFELDARYANRSSLRSGRFRRVFSIAASRRHRAISPWSPETRTSGTGIPRNSCGRV